MPAFKKAQTENPDVHFIFLNQGESEEIIKIFLTQKNLTLNNILLDQSRDAAKILNQQSLPVSFFFDAEGYLIHIRQGELSYATLTNQIKIHFKSLDN